MKRRALILCTGNSCRSQIAEALINERLGDRWEAYSAGTDPAGYVHPKALETLREIGILHEGTSKNINDLERSEYDIVITVCDDAAQNCPVWLGQRKRHHIGFPDPARTEGSEEKIASVFRDVRDSIEARLLPFLEGYFQGEKGK